MAIGEQSLEVNESLGKRLQTVLCSKVSQVFLFVPYFEQLLMQASPVFKVDSRQVV